MGLRRRGCGVGLQGDGVMARIRSIHPGFFTDDRLVCVSMSARMLFIGLGVEADDKGTFEWKPLTLKMRIFPADNLDVSILLEELEDVDAIASYEIDGRKYGAIRNFRKFQKPKTPNDIHPIPNSFRKYVGLCEVISEAFHQNGEKSPQMEDGGCNREDGGSIGIAETGNPPAREPTQPGSHDERPEPLASSPSNGPTANGQCASAQQSLIPLDQAQPPPKRPRRVKTALPPDWRLPDDGWSYAAGKGLTGDRIEQEAEKFRDYHLSRGNVMADWAAAWRTWVGNAGKFSAPVAGGYRQNDPPSRADSAIQGIKNFLIRNGELP